MITYCSNAVKIVSVGNHSTLESFKNGDQTVGVIFPGYFANSETVKWFKVNFLDWNDNGVFGLDNTRILNELTRLFIEREEYLKWKKANG